MAESIKQLEDQAIETKLTTKNIQAKIIDIEKKHLLFEDRIKTLEKEMKVTKQTEKKLDAKIKAEAKTLQKEIKNLESSFENKLYKKCKPIEDKVMIALGSADDLENEVEQIKEAINALQAAPANTEKEQDGEQVIVALPTKPKEEKQSRANVMAQILDGEVERLKKEFDSRFENFEKKMKDEVGKLNRSSFDTFLDLKESNQLFEQVNHGKRNNFARDLKGNSPNAKNFRHKLVQNEMVLYQLYGRYKELMKELDIYKEKIMDNLWFGSKQTNLLVKDPKLRKRSNSLSFKVFPVQDSAIGKARIDIRKMDDPENEYERWNKNIDGRIEDLENFVERSNKKFHESVRNRGILAQEIRVMEGVLNNLRHEVEDLKNNTSKKANEESFFKQTTMEPGDGSMTPSVRQTIDEKFKNVKKNYDREIDQYANDIKSLEVQLVKFEKLMENKVDKSYIDTLEASINGIIKQNKSNSSVSNLMKELTEDILTIKDRIEFNFEKNDNCMEDFDKRITRYDEEYQKFLDEADEIEKYKNKNKVLEIKIDKLFHLLKQHAFDPDSLSEQVDEEIKMNIDISGEKAENPVPKDSQNPKRRMSKVELGAKKQIEAIHAMYIKLETEVDDLRDKVKEKEYAARMVEQSAMEIAQGKKPENISLKGVRDRDVHRIMNVEFMGMKQLIGKHQITLNRVEKCLRDLEEFRNQNNYGKFNQEQKKQADDLKALIAEVNDYHSNLITKLQGKLHKKPDLDVLEMFQKNVNEKVLNLLVQKIDKDEHRRLQGRLNRKINHLEKEMTEINSKSNQDEQYKSPFLVTNNKCFSCNRHRDNTPDKKAQTATQDFSSSKNKYIFKELYKKGPKMGASFSRILNKLDKPETVSTMRQKDAANQIVERTPKANPEMVKPKTGSSDFTKLDSNKVMTPKVDVNTGHHRMRNHPVLGEFPLTDRGKLTAKKKDRTTVVIHKRNKTSQDREMFKTNKRFGGSGFKQGNAKSRRDLGAYRASL